MGGTAGLGGADSAPVLGIPPHHRQAARPHPLVPTRRNRHFSRLKHLGNLSLRRHNSVTAREHIQPELALQFDDRPFDFRPLLRKRQ